MNLLEMKQKVLGLIEELDPESEYLTDDPDIATKINEVTNQILFELARIKKIPKYVEMKVDQGDLGEFADIEKAVVGGEPVYLTMRSTRSARSVASTMYPRQTELF